MVIRHVIAFLEFLAKPAVGLAMTFLSVKKREGRNYSSGQAQAVS